MALRNVIKEGDEVLRKNAREIKRFDERLAELASDMLETMKESNGIGLAAPQVGILKRIFVMNLEDEYAKEGDMIIINPEIVEREGEQENVEGCLSLPGLYGRVKRPAKLRLKYNNLQGEECELEAEGLLATCICHENDHLGGTLFRDKIIGNPFRYDQDGKAIDSVTGEELSEYSINKTSNSESTNKDA